MSEPSLLPAGEQISPDVYVYSDVMVVMRDGVRLATDIYWPAQDGKPLPGPFPVVMERTPYGKTEKSRSEVDAGMTTPRARAELGSYFARAGYIAVYQDCRGRYKSEGEFVKYLSDGADGYDTCAWITAQPWCNGKIGTMGLSYAAHTQAALATLNAPGLTCMILDSGGFSNAFTCGIRQGGAFELKQATWAYNQSQEVQSDPLVIGALEAEDIKAWFQVMPWSEGRSPVRWVPEYEAYLLDQWRAGTFDERWKQPGIYLAGAYDTLPDHLAVTVMSSWYDVYVPTTMENFAGIGQNGRRPVKLIMGAALHGNRNHTYAGDVSFGDEATLDGHIAENWLAYRRRWFDRWLKGIDNGVDSDATARLFLMGGGSGGKNKDGRLDHGGRWIQGTDWPLPEADPMVLHLHADGQLSSEKQARGAAQITYDFDPNNPVPTIGGSLTSGQPVFEGGGFDQREAEQFYGCKTPGLPLSARPDVLSFESAPLDEDMAVVGPVEVDLWVSSDMPDTDFTIKLVDVYPPSKDYPTGYSLIISDGIFRCRYRKSFEKPELLTPGEVFKITVKGFATANLFAKGHRIRLDVSSSNFPKFDVNPNTGAPEGTGRTKNVARNSVYLNADQPSHLRLSVVPNGKLKYLD
ncbi:CocE/NonD family hydrolase [Lacibacterium aquatile]|uniref:CocE/NonD family hydrolase n=1 Tax=Lacibacterium aquatile TaxID=1168082 RepID=A0ABW5DQP8_9PROT